MLEITELCAGYRRAVIQGCTLTVRPGELVGLLGPNGCGKSTLLRAVTGGAKIFGGTVRIDGQPLLQLSTRARATKAALLLQRTAIPAGVRVYEVIEQGAYARCGPFGAPPPALAADCAARFGLTDLLQCDYAILSGGQQQLVLLARLAAQQTPVLLLDEPDTALDFANRHQLFCALQALAKAENKAVLMVLHDPATALRWCERLYLMAAQGTLAGQLRPNAGAAEAQAALQVLYPGIRIGDIEGGGFWCAMAD